jgi:hypothetical protein
MPLQNVKFEICHYNFPFSPLSHYILLLYAFMDKYTDLTDVTLYSHADTEAAGASSAAGDMGIATLPSFWR